MQNNQIEFFVDQRIANEVDMLIRKRNFIYKKDPKQNNNEDDEDFQGNIQYNDIEHLQTYKQVRVGFEGKQLTQWSNALYYFIIKYSNYPLEPVTIQFPKEFRHQYIIQNTGIYCHPEWSQKYWKQSTTLEQIINRVIQTFHEIPTYSDYPVDLSFIQLSLNKEEYSKVIKANQDCATIMISKIQDERDYIQQKKKFEEQLNANQMKKEEEYQMKKIQKQKQDEEYQNQKLIQKQQQEYQNQLQNNSYPQFYQSQQQQFQQNDQIQQQYNKNINVYNQPQSQQINQQQQGYSEPFNPNQQQQNYNQSNQFNINPNLQNQIKFISPPLQQQNMQQQVNNQPQVNNLPQTNNPKIRFL